jgi:hypothetical protein
VTSASSPTPSFDAARWSLGDQVLDDPSALSWLGDRYFGNRVVRNVLAQAFASGAQSAAIEYRYLDPHYRDEHSTFYSRTFRRYPAVAHRLHLFSNPPPDTLGAPEVAARFTGLGYLGFSVLRPVPAAPVGRTYLAPPPELDRYVSCRREQTVNLFGDELTVSASPFMAQDAQLLRCAHATLWVCGQLHSAMEQTTTILPSDVAAAVPSELGIGRPVPSVGLTIHQISAAATRLGFPPLVYDLSSGLPGNESLFKIACRYLNSGIPVIVAGGGHAFVLVGYRRTDPQTPDERIQFIRQDDEVGPYQVVANCLLDIYSPWQFLVIPLPHKVYMAGEDAEVVGSIRLEAALNADGFQAPPSGWSWRSTLLKSNDFKTQLSARGVPDREATIYRRTHMSRWIWVVEAVDRSLRDAGERAVVAEAVIDATDHLRDRHLLAWRTPTAMRTWAPDADRVDAISGLPVADPVATVSRLPY